MRITQEELHDLVVDTVRRYEGGGMERRRIIERVEERLRRRGAWEPPDDAWSASVDSKSIGRAAIDWAISDLSREHRLEALRRNCWVVATEQPERKTPGQKLLMDAMTWAASRPEVLDKLKALIDKGGWQQHLVEEYYAWDMR
jgi:hypothetical protein